MRKGLVLIIVIVVVAAGGYWLLNPNRGTATAQGDTQWESVTVGRGTITVEVAASGVVEPEEEVSLAFRVPGRVAQVYVSEGDQVDEGQLLAVLDTSELELQVKQAQLAVETAELQLEKAMKPPAEEDLAAARAAVASAVAAYNRLLEGPTAEQLTIAQAQVKKAEIALQQAQSAYDQVKWVGGIGALQPSLALQAATLDYEAAKANYEMQTSPPEDKDLKAVAAQIAQAQAQLARLERGADEHDIALLRKQVEQARLAAEQAELQLEHARLVAPFGGIVSQVLVSESQMVSVGVPVVRLLDCRQFHVMVDVDESDIGQIAVGNRATLEAEAFPGLLIQGHVSMIGTSPVSQEGSASALLGGAGVTQYPVRVDVDQSYARLRPGMTAQVVIEVARHENVLVVPNSAVERDKETGIMFVEKLVDGSPVPVEVILGIPGDGVSQVLAGLDEGDTIIIRSVSTREELMRAFGPAGREE